MQTRNGQQLHIEPTSITLRDVATLLAFISSGGTKGWQNSESGFPLLD